jgi:peptidoglycan-associated lipoprotein
MLAPPPPTVQPTASVADSSSLAVSDEIAMACKLNFDDVDNAPKFDFDESALSAQDDSTLSQIAKCVTTGPLAGRALDLVGRADSRGLGPYNIALGERRADTVRDYLSTLGVNGAKLTARSRGKLDATGTEEIGWKRDRRVDVLLP